MTTGVTAQFLVQMQRFFPDEPPTKLGIALSGGGDSVALLTLMAGWRTKAGPDLYAITIDHGLRAGSAAEAQDAKAHCDRLRIPHQILRWQGWTGQGNLQDVARRARRKLISDWAQKNTIQTVAVGHTADDQAETMLMRLARGSGVDGLSGMAVSSHNNHVNFIRPLLTHRRDDLRQYLRDLGLGWADDPSNEDTRFDRIKARQAIEGLANLGITVDGLVQTASRLRSTRGYLEQQLAQVARNLTSVTVLGDVLIDRKEFVALHVEMQQRLMAHALKWVASTPYRPRQSSLADVLLAVGHGQVRTLAGCRIICEKDDRIRVFREYQAVKDQICSANSIWDNRWRLSGPVGDGWEIKVLAESGLAKFTDWRDLGHPQASLLASPAVYRHGDVIATVFAENSTATKMNLINDQEQFYSAVITH